MTTQNLALFQALGTKMDYLNQRQRLIAQNVSNADTPGYKSQDLEAMDFGSVLKNITHDKSRSIHAARTNSGHLRSKGDFGQPEAKIVRNTYENAPNGNSVIMEEQLIKAGENVMDYNLMTSIYQKNVGMIKTALGRQG